MRRAILVIGAVVWVGAGCCGSMQVKEGRLDQLGLPTPTRALDEAHARIAAEGRGILYAGAAMVDITTDLAYREGIYLGGFDMGRKNRGVRDPVFAHILYLDDGKTPFVLIELDTIGYGNDDSRSLRARITDRWAQNVVVASIHNHVGPDTVGYWGPACLGYIPVCSGRVPEYMEALQRIVAAGVDQAVRSARPARIRVAKGLVDPTLSRNIHPAIANQKDDVVRVLQVQGEDGTPIAVLANWGCHVEALWNDDQLSADWAGAFYRRMQERGLGVPILVMGALGGLVSIDPGEEKMAMDPKRDIMTVFLKHMSIEERLALMHRVADGLADAVTQALDRADPAVGPGGISLHLDHQDLELLQKNWVFEYMGNRGLIQRSVVTRGRQIFLPTEVAVVQARHQGAPLFDLHTVPGEPAPPLVAEMDATAQAPVVFTVALGNDEVGYMVREEDWDSPNYEYERTMSLGRTTGTTVLRTIQALRDRLYGRTPAP